MKTLQELKDHITWQIRECNDPYLFVDETYLEGKAEAYKEIQELIKQMLGEI